MAASFPRVDLSHVRTYPLGERANKVSLDRFAKPPVAGGSAAEFLDGLPRLLAGDDFHAVVDAIANAHLNGRPVIVGFGAHVIKCGLSPILIDLMERGIVMALATNGSGSVHDFELAMIGETSEDVAAGLRDGSFGMVRETGEWMHAAINRSNQRPDAGMGELLGEYLAETTAPNAGVSLLASAHRLGVPFTVHVALGTDIIHMHPAADGAAMGRASLNDFRIFAARVKELSGGVYLNIGSAVIMPEVFLKAFTVAQNLGANLHDYTTVTIDMTAQYRAGENVVRRPAGVAGKGYTLLGRHEFLLPLLAQAVVERCATGNRIPRPKLIDLDSLVAVRERYRREGKTVVWTNGCFDLLHPGHVSSLQAAREKGNVLVVGLNGDASVRSNKGPGRPILAQHERAATLAALECVDHVLMFDDATPERVLVAVKPDVHCKGAEYAPPHGRPVPEAATVLKYGGRIEYLPLVPGVSTTDIVARIAGRRAAA
jgi:rfaE bifunctional protein nucleotidyltransferase chain/domain